MKAEYINPFIIASTKIIKEMTDINVKVGKIYVKNSSYRSENILVIIGLTGKYMVM